MGTEKSAKHLLHGLVVVLDFSILWLCIVKEFPLYKGAGLIVEKVTQFQLKIA